MTPKPRLGTGPRKDLEELRRLALAATPGPWRVIGKNENGWEIETDDQRDVTASYCHGCGGIYHHPDAAYIAAANPATVIALLDEVERLRDIMEAWEAIAFYNSGTEHEPVQSLDHEDYLLLESAFYKARLLQESRQP